MNDYKKLVETLRNGTKSPLHVTPNGFMALDVGVVNAIADVIEQLMKERDELVTKCHRLEKERDAAVDDLRINCDCDFCKWLIGGDCTDLEHEECHGEYWEWRGVREDNDETD